MVPNSTVRQPLHRPEERTRAWLIGNSSPWPRTRANTASPKPGPRSPTRRSPYLQCAGPFHSSSPSSRCRFTLRSSRPTTSAASSARRSTSASPSSSAAPSAARRSPPASAPSRSAATAASPGPALAAALIRGLASTGLDVVDLGPVTTPMLYYVAATRGAHGCSERHPGHGQPQPEGLQRLQDGRSPAARSTARRSSACAGAWRPRTTPRAEGRTATMDILAEYRARIVGDCKLARPMTIAVDSGNGIAGASAPGILRALGCTRARAVFGGRRRLPEPPPRPEQAGEPRRADRRGRSAGDAELGLAFDGDGDRLGVVTKDGKIIYPDRQLMLFARDVLQAQPRARRSSSTSSARSSWRR